MTQDHDNLKLLIRAGEKPPQTRGMPMMHRLSDPGKPWPRLRRFFRPWRLLGRTLVVGTPFWVTAVVLAGVGWVAELFSSAPAGAGPGLSTPAVLALMPFGILVLWAVVSGVRDLLELGRNRRDARAYGEALARLGEPDVLTPADFQSPGIREGLLTLGHFESLLAAIDKERDNGRVSALLRDSLHESRRLVLRSVLDLIATERRLIEWSARLGDESAYKAKLEARRGKLVGSYTGILDQCLVASDQALARADEDPADLQRTIEGLLVSCQRALDAVEGDGPAFDEQELLMYAARERDAKQAKGPDGPASEGVGTEPEGGRG